MNFRVITYSSRKLIELSFTIYLLNLEDVIKITHPPPNVHSLWCVWELCECVSDRLVTYKHFGFTFRPILLLKLSVFPLICRHCQLNLVFPMSYLSTPQTMNFVYNVIVTYISYRMRGDPTMFCAGIFATLIDFYGEHLGQLIGSQN